MNALSAAIFSRLTGGTALTALLADGTAGIFEDHASQTASLPYVVFSQQSGTWDFTMDGTRFPDIVYTIKAVSGSAYPKQASAIDAAIDARIHNASLSPTGYTSIAFLRESDIQYSEQSGDQIFWHVGALYRAELQKS